MRKSLALLFLFQFCTLFAQEEWTILDLTDRLKDKVEAVYPIVNEKTGFSATFLKANNEIIGFYHNEKQELQTTITIDSPRKNLDVFVGSAYDGDKFTLFFSNNSESKYSCLKVDFATNSYDIIVDLNIATKKERIISYIESDSELHLISVLKNSSLLNRKTLKIDGSINEVTYDLSQEVLESDTGLSISFYSLIFGKKSENPIQTINTNVPNSLEQTSAFTKVYQNEEHIQISNNSYQKHTYLLNLDVSSNAYKLDKIENKLFDKKNRKSNANSFILNDKFFDAYSTTDGITLNMYDTRTQKQTKTFNIIPGDSISFKNSPIIFEKGGSESYRDLEKTTRFVRKVNSSNIGIGAYAFEDKYILTLGASEKNDDLSLVVIGGVLFGVLGAAVMSAFDTYGSTDSVRIECLFDADFNHVSGEIPNNGFDLINAFIKTQNLKNAAVQTVFKYQDKYIWGYYHAAGKFYRFHQFNSFEK